MYVAIITALGILMIILRSIALNSLILPWLDRMTSVIYARSVPWYKPCGFVSENDIKEIVEGFRRPARRFVVPQETGRLKDEESPLDLYGSSNKWSANYTVHVLPCQYYQTPHTHFYLY